ncbi:MAG: hypothetical protein N4A61_15655 [Pelagimonas sp.]|nr:hypothetical protein [Pelagimonas sp.]
MLKLILGAVMICLATTAGADGFGFQTPSGNIYCNGHITGGGGISCVIVNRSGALAAPRPGSCSGVWGHDFNLDARGPASLSCNTWPGHPKTVGYTNIAPYGETSQFGDITCQSERTGLTCRNKSGHGFFLSRKKQRVF